MNGKLIVSFFHKVCILAANSFVFREFKKFMSSIWCKLTSVLLKVQDTNPLVYLFAKTWHYSRGNRVKVGVFWFMFVLVELGDLCVMPFVWSRIINIVQEQGLTKSSTLAITLLLLLGLAWTVTFWSLHGPARVMECSNAFNVRANYRKHLLSGVMNLPMEWHVDHHSGETIDRIEKGVNSLYLFSEDSFEVVYSIVRLLGTFAILTSQFRPAGIIMLVMMLVTSFIIIRFDKVLVPQYQTLGKKENIVSESTFDGLSNITTVIILRIEALVFKAIMHKVEEPYELFRNTSVRNEWKWFFVSLCCRITVILILGSFLLQHFWRNEIVLGGTIFLIINYSQRMTDLFNRFAGMYGDIVQRRAKISNAELLSQDFKSSSFTNHVLPVNWRTLEMLNLHFSYAGDLSESIQLENINLKIERGKNYALIGESGSGKTTLLKIIRYLYPLQTGEVVVDGVKISEGFGGIARDIALVPQGPEIFATTVWENITLGAEYPRELVELYSDMACFTEVVYSLPHQYESKTKEKGVNLSGGQQQRLALTRGLLASHDKGIVLLDEPTSSLDVTTEMRIYQNILNGFSDKTVLSSIHRLHLLPLFDEIVMFSGGRIVGLGTLQNLLMNCPEFVELWERCQV